MIISTVKASTLYESDVYPASFYITHPTNTVEDNRAAGSDGYGIYYNFGSPYNKVSIETIPISSQNNVVHSNQKTGLRINRVVPATPLATWPTKNTFEGYTAWNNKENGVQTTNGPFTVFNKLVVINFGKTGISIENENKNCKD